ncbi:MAG: hypothetical protein JXA30_09885 [Deltaproteobacteria bacterium]|nr:hypothetical protein [Deltaproteobacteria bacterium]
MSIRPVLLTNSFFVFVIFISFVLVPASVYFYLFHGDWFLLYSINVQRIPSAVALLLFVLEAAIGFFGFLIGAILARGQQLSYGYFLIGTSVLASLSVLFVCPERLAVIGSYAQYHGDFGLQSYGSSVVMKGTLAVGTILIIGIVFLITSLNYRNARNP